MGYVQDTNTNRSSRLVALWLDNDEGLYLQRQEAKDIDELKGIVEAHYDYTKENEIAGLGMEEDFDMEEVDWDYVWDKTQVE